MLKKNAASNQFEDYKINIRLKLSALWVSVTLCYLYGDYFELYVPQKTQGLADGSNLLDSPFKLLIAAIFMAIPATMVFLSIILKPSLSRCLNIVFGSFFTLVMMIIVFNSFTPWLSFYIFLAVVEIIITLFIIWNAWKWPKVD